MIYNKFIEKIILPIGDLYNRSFYINQLKYWRKVDSFSEQELEELQNNNLKELLINTVKNVPKYQKISLKGDDPHLWLQEFPILNKEDIRDDLDNLISITTNKKELIAYSSSGSSGIQSTVYMTKKEQSNIRAILTHWWEWSGYKIGNPIIQTGISPDRGYLKSIKDILFKTIYINAFNHSEKQLERLSVKIKNRNNTFYIAGYASSLNVVSEYFLKKGLKIKLKAAISFGDKLFEVYKKNIKSAFDCDVFDNYACNEGFLIASQKDLEYKYIMSPHVYLEILDNNNNPVPDGEIGNVVVTRLDGFSMPLIRYRIGDLAIKLPKENYPVKRDFNYPLLKKIVGRETDIIYLPNNEKMVVHSFTGIFEYITEIKQFKVIQENINEILIEYIKTSKFTNKVLERVTIELQKHIQDKNFKINYKEVDFIPSTKSGKPQIIESKLLKK